MAKGNLIIKVYSDTIANPVKGAQVTISKDDSNIDTIFTDENGETNIISLDTVDKSYSEEEQYKTRPYETYDITVNSLGLTETKLEGVQIFDGVTSIQNVYLTSIDEKTGESVSEISSNTLWGEYPPYISEDEEETDNGIMPLVLHEVQIPETIIVHDGIPSNSNASNYTVRFIDYIKNVASSEIYSTWPKETIKANVLAIISFALNRVYTEWYQSQGYNFTITSTTSYDQKYTRNGTIFEPISKVVDEIFNNYIRKGIRLNPLLAHYKSSTTEAGYLSQWGSKELGDKGYNYLQILKNYYGNEIDIYKAEVTGEYPYSFKTTLKQGDCSNDVYILQNTLNYIRGSFPGIPVIENPTGQFNSATTSAVKTFQSVFDLPVTGNVDYKTWYSISYIYSAVSNMTKSIYN